MAIKSFENLSQRSIYYFIATYPSFYPLSTSNVSEIEQKEAYTFIKDAYLKIYRHPELLGLKMLPDDSLEDRELNKENPHLVTEIRTTIKKTEEFIKLLWTIAHQGTVNGRAFTLGESEIKVTPAGMKQLAAFSIQTEKLDNAYRFTFPISVNGLKILAELSETNARPSKDGIRKPYLLYSRGVFDAGAPWSREVFGNMLDDRKPFDKLIDFLEQNGYRRLDNKEYDNKISLDYIRSYGDPADEVKSAWAERTHSGIEVTYEELRKNQFSIWLRMPYFKEILQNEDKLSDQAKNFIITTSKKCDGCRYCVQTDKTGKRPLACIPLDNYMLCPMFPGFYYRWKTLDDNTVENMIDVLQFIDRIFADRRN